MNSLNKIFSISLLLIVLAALSSCDDEEKEQLKLIEKIFNDPDILWDYYHPDSLYYLDDYTSSDSSIKREINKYIKILKNCVKGEYSYAGASQIFKRGTRIEEIVDGYTKNKIEESRFYDFECKNLNDISMRVSFAKWKGYWTLEYITFVSISKPPWVAPNECFYRESHSVSLD